MLDKNFTQGCFALFLIFTVSTVESVHANTGTISFSGNVIMPTCTVSGSTGASGSGHSIEVTLGDVPMDGIISGNWNPVHSQIFALVVACPGSMTGYTRARITFNAPGGSGVDPDDTRMLKLTAASTASGVAVGLYRIGEPAPMDMSVAPSVTGNFMIIGSNSVASMNMHAQYKRTSAPQGRQRIRYLAADHGIRIMNGTAMDCFVGQLQALSVDSLS